MLEIIKDPTFAERNIPLGILEVTYPDRSSWDITKFYDLVHAELDALREKYAKILNVAKTTTARLFSVKIRIFASSRSSRKPILSCSSLNPCCSRAVPSRRRTR